MSLSIKSRLGFFTEDRSDSLARLPRRRLGSPHLLVAAAAEYVELEARGNPGVHQEPDCIAGETVGQGHVRHGRGKGR